MAGRGFGSVFVWTDKGAAVTAVDKLVQRVALEVQRDAKTLAPVDTGTLQASITSGRLAADENQVVYLVGTNIHYAPHQEFGTSRMAAHPFLGPALEMARGRYG